MPRGPLYVDQTWNRLYGWPRLFDFYRAHAGATRGTGLAIRLGFANDPHGPGWDGIRTTEHFAARRSKEDLREASTDLWIQLTYGLRGT